ncbi:MAG: nucleotidyltransferase family protein [Chloroflexi bacterium]|nr:nucleotidyltransferase family protein [Chloroflexota bacterium]
MAKVKSLDIRDMMRTLKSAKEELTREYGIKEIGLFGSWVRGEQKRGSDLDVLVEFEPGRRIGLLGFIHIENRLSDLLGVKVDLVEKSALKPRIGKHILEETVYL